MSLFYANIYTLMREQHNANFMYYNIYFCNFKRRSKTTFKKKKTKKIIMNNKVTKCQIKKQKKKTKIRL